MRLNDGSDLVQTKLYNFSTMIIVPTNEDTSMVIWYDLLVTRNQYRSDELDKRDNNVRLIWSEYRQS